MRFALVLVIAMTATSCRNEYPVVPRQFRNVTSEQVGFGYVSVFEHRATGRCFMGLRGGLIEVDREMCKP